MGEPSQDRYVFGATLGHGQRHLMSYNGVPHRREHRLRRRAGPAAFVTACGGFDEVIAS
jgi:hypothetical protein